MLVKRANLSLLSGSVIVAIYIYIPQRKAYKVQLDANHREERESSRERYIIRLYWMSNTYVCKYTRVYMAKRINREREREMNMS